MDLAFKVIQIYPHAEEIWDFTPVSHPTPMTTSAIQLNLHNKEHWVQLNDVLRFYGKDAMYIFSFGKKRVDMGFDIFLKNFEIGRYQGTMRAASYASQVLLRSGEEHRISMNEPLKKNGLTIYQASFQENDRGEPIASVFSVNEDPGRWIKYFGSLLISVGVLWLFVNKRRQARMMYIRKGNL
jgi:ResB-like family